MSSEQDKDLVAKKMHVACERSGARAERSYFLQSGERLSEDPAPLAHTLSAARSAQNAPLVIC